MIIISSSLFTLHSSLFTLDDSISLSSCLSTSAADEMCSLTLSLPHSLSTSHSSHSTLSHSLTLSLTQPRTPLTQHSLTRHSHCCSIDLAEQLLEHIRGERDVLSHSLTPALTQPRTPLTQHSQHSLTRHSHCCSIDLAEQLLEHIRGERDVHQVLPAGPYTSPLFRYLNLRRFLSSPLCHRFVTAKTPQIIPPHKSCRLQCVR